MQLHYSALLGFSALLVLVQPALAQSPSQAPAPDSPGPTPTYGSSILPDRWDEDWSWVQGDDEFPLNFKNIDLGDIKLSIGADWRTRAEWRNPNNFGVGNAGAVASAATRALTSLDARLGDSFRAYVQLGMWDQTGKDRPSLFDEADLALQRGFLDWNLNPTTTLRTGRQDLFKVSSRLLSPADVLNYQPVYDALVLRIRDQSLRVQAFTARPYFTADGYFEETDFGDATFSGLFVEREFEQLPGYAFGAYAMWQERDRVLFPQRAGAEQRGTVIGRVTRRASSWSLSAEVGYQFGELGERDISGWAFASEAGFTFDNAQRTRLTLRVDGASGDDLSAETSEAWSSSAPAMSFLGRNGVYAATNAISAFPEFSFSATPELRITLGGEFAWRADRDDAFFSAPGTILLPAGSGGDNLVLAGGGVQAAYTLSPNVDLRGVLYWLGPQGAFESSGGKAQTGANLSLIGRF